MTQILVEQQSPFETRLYRTPYLVIPRIALQSMPMDWQRRFAALLDEAEATGLETPQYYVLRADREYTTTTKYDESDPTSRNYEYTAISEDPWANYRRGNIKDLQPDFNPQKGFTDADG